MRSIDVSSRQPFGWAQPACVQGEQLEDAVTDARHAQPCQTAVMDRKAVPEATLLLRVLCMLQFRQNLERLGCMWNGEEGRRLSDDEGGCDSNCVGFSTADEGQSQRLHLLIKDNLV